MNRKFTAQDLTIGGLFTALTAVGAFIKITIPVEPYAMHFTLQWLFVMLDAMVLGCRRATMSVCAYLIIGLAGVPIFASGGGLGYLIRPTFGYLLGFALAAFVISYMIDHNIFCKKKNFIGLLIPATVGLFVYYGMGMIYFYIMSNFVISAPVGLRIVLVNCCLLTIFPDFLLCILAALIGVRIRPVVLKMIN